MNIRGRHIYIFGHIFWVRYTPLFMDMLIFKFQLPNCESIKSSLCSLLTNFSGFFLTPITYRFNEETIHLDKINHRIHNSNGTYKRNVLHIWQPVNTFANLNLKYKHLKHNLIIFNSVPNNIFYCLIWYHILNFGCITSLHWLGWLPFCCWYLLSFIFHIHYLHFLHYLHFYFISFTPSYLSLIYLTLPLFAYSIASTCNFLSRVDSSFDITYPIGVTISTAWYNCFNGYCDCVFILSVASSSTCASSVDYDFCVLTAGEFGRPCV